MLSIFFFDLLLRALEYFHREISLLWFEYYVLYFFLVFDFAYGAFYHDTFFPNFHIFKFIGALWCFGFYDKFRTSHSVEFIHYSSHFLYLR